MVEEVEEVEEMEEMEEIEEVEEVEEVEEMEEVEEVKKEKEEKEKEGIVVMIKRRDFLKKKIAEILLQILYLIIMRMLIPKRLTKNSPQEKKTKTEI